MAAAQEFTLWFLNSLAAFLGSEPIFYLFCLILLLFIGQFLKILMRF